METEIKAQIPNIDPLISEYTAGYLAHAANAYVSDADSGALTPLAEAQSSIIALLLSASGDFSQQNEDAIRNLVTRFVNKLDSSADPERRQMAPTARRLDQAIHVGSQRNVSSTMGLAAGNIDLESANARKVESRVDKKKLEKNSI